MVSFRRSRKGYRRNRKLSKANIYGNRSAKSQSRQIAAINSKLNRYIKQNRPEIRTIFRTYSHEFNNSALNSNYSGVSLSPYSANFTADDNVYSVEPEGNFCRCKGISVRLITQYADNWRDSIADASHDPSAGYHIIIFQEKLAAPLSQASSVTPIIQDIFNFSNSQSSGDENLTAPLVSGITSTYKILYHKVFTINRYHPTRLHNINIPESKCLNFSKEVNSSGASTTGKGRVWCLLFTGGLHYDIDYTARINATMSLKIAYTDN